MDFRERRKQIKEKHFSRAILLRGYGSMSEHSDMDLLDDRFKCNQLSVLIDGVCVDKFQIYMIKRIKIRYKDLVVYTQCDGTLLEPVEKYLFLLKDYLHLSKYRKEKHIYYSRIEGVDKDFLGLGLSFPLEVSSSSLGFFIRSIKVKLWYYGDFYLRSRWCRKDTNS